MNLIKKCVGWKMKMVKYLIRRLIFVFLRLIFGVYKLFKDYIDVDKFK